MRRLLARMGLPVLAAAALAIANLPAAHADPVDGSENRCSAQVWVQSDVSVTTCTYFRFWDQGFHHSHRTRVTVYNGGSWGPVIVTPDIEVGFSVIRSGSTTVDRGVQLEVWGDEVVDVPWQTHVQGRANIWSYYWSTMTIAPQFP